MADEMNNNGVAMAESASLRNIHAQFMVKLNEKMGEQLGLLFEMAEENGVRRSYIVYALAGFVSLLLLFSGAAPLLANLLGVVYPLCASAVVIHTQDSAEASKWLAYWSVFGVFIVVDEAIGYVRSPCHPVTCCSALFPAYYLLKTVLLLTGQSVPALELVDNIQARLAPIIAAMQALMSKLE